MHVGITGDRSRIAGNTWTAPTQAASMTVHASSNYNMKASSSHIPGQACMCIWRIRDMTINMLFACCPTVSGGCWRIAYPWHICMQWRPWWASWLSAAYMTGHAVCCPCTHTACGVGLRLAYLYAMAAIVAILAISYIHDRTRISGSLQANNNQHGPELLLHASSAASAGSRHDRL